MQITFFVEKSNLDISKGLVNRFKGFIIEVIWRYIRGVQMHTTDISSVQIAFGRNGISVIQPKSIQFPVMYNYTKLQKEE